MEAMVCNKFEQFLAAYNKCVKLFFGYEKRQSDSCKKVFLGIKVAYSIYYNAQLNLIDIVYLIVVRML